MDAKRNGSRLITDGTGATDGLEARVSKVEGVLAQMCPRPIRRWTARGGRSWNRTGELDTLASWRSRVDATLTNVTRAAHERAERLCEVERLIAASVPVPAKVNVRGERRIDPSRP